MYNRYIPDESTYTRVDGDAAPPESRHRQNTQSHAPPPGTAQAGGNEGRAGGTHHAQGPMGGMGFKLPSFLAGKDELGALFSGKDGGGLSGLLGALKLDDIDTGDILLLLIMLYLLVEGDDLELVIALGLVLIMGLGDSTAQQKETEENVDT